MTRVGSTERAESGGGGLPAPRAGIARASAAMRHELIGLSGVVERNWYLVKRYAWWEVAFFVWTVANTLTIVFIAKGVEAAGGEVDVDRLTAQLLIGAVIWAYLGIIFEILTETVAWERWEGTIEYTFMAPLSRSVHLIGMGAFAVLYGVVRASLLFGVVAAMFHLALPGAAYGTALVLLAIASVSFIGVGMMTAVLPLISPEKGTQLGFVAQGLMLVVSGVYYPVSVLPSWMQWIAKISPATYALRGNRNQILSGAGLAWADVWPLLVIGACSIPLGLLVFRAGERYAKQHGKLKRSG
jgi:ABC-2 type transport system permease protein